MKLIKFDGDLKNKKKSTTDIDKLLKASKFRTERDVLLDIDNLLDLQLSKYSYQDVFETIQSFILINNNIELVTPFIINKKNDLEYILWDYVNGMKYKKVLSDQIIELWPFLIDFLDDESINKLFKDSKDNINKKISIKFKNIGSLNGEGLDLHLEDYTNKQTVKIINSKGHDITESFNETSTENEQLSLF